MFLLVLSFILLALKGNQRTIALVCFVVFCLAAGYIPLKQTRKWVQHCERSRNRGRSGGSPRIGAAAMVLHILGGLDPSTGC